MKKLLQIPITSNRIFGLDIVRAAAILFVILTHSGNFIPRNWMFWYKSLIYDGVGVFFVLSGFLIGGILIKQIETYKFNFKSLLYFWSKRWSRTLPNYFLFLIILLILESFINDNFQIRQHLSYFIFSQNLTSSPPSFFSHSWSLSVEEWFYLVTPFLLFIFMSIFKFKFKYVFLITIFGIIVFVTIFRLYEIRNISNWNEFKNITYGVIYRFDSLMYGMLGAHIAYYFPKFWNHYKKQFLYVFFFLFIMNYIVRDYIDSSNYFAKTMLFSLTSLTVLCSFPYLSNLKTSKSKLVKPITYISLVSYSLYLVNSVIVERVEKLINWEFIINFFYNQFSIALPWTFALLFNYVTSWFLSFFIATLVYKYFEIPSTGYLRKKIKISLDKK